MANSKTTAYVDIDALILFKDVINRNVDEVNLCFDSILNLYRNIEGSGWEDENQSIFDDIIEAVNSDLNKFTELNNNLSNKLSRIIEIINRYIESNELNTETLSSNSETLSSNFEGLNKADFTGKLRGNDITLEGVKTQEVNYVKRSTEERKTLRRAFDTTERKKFLKKLSENESVLKEAGLTEDDILDMKDGCVPEGWQVHHKLPLDDSGDNSFENLILIKNEPYHKVMTNYQNSITKGLGEGDSKVIDFPVPEGNIYPPKNKQEEWINVER